MDETERGTPPYNVDAVQQIILFPESSPMIDALKQLDVDFSSAIVGLHK